MKGLKKKNVTTEDLAIMMNNNFERLEEKMATKDDVKDIRRDVLNLGDKFVSYHTFDSLANRVKVLEEKKK